MKKSPRKTGFFLVWMLEFKAKKCPHQAGINPFLGGDGGDRFILPQAFVRCNIFRAET